MPKALVAGATGAVGKHVLTQLIDSPEVDQIYAFTRREGALPVSDKVIQILLTGDNGADFAQLPTDIDVVFDCVGTTIKQAGSKENFYKTDYTFNAELAQKCKTLNIPQFHLVSSMSSDSASSTFYLRTKGELEDFMKTLDFPYLAIYRPGVLHNAERANFRLGECVFGGILSGLSWITRKGFIGTAAPIDVRTVAKAMLTNYKLQAANATFENNVEIFDGSTYIENFLRR